MINHRYPRNKQESQFSAPTTPSAEPYAHPNESSRMNITNVDDLPVAPQWFRFTDVDERTTLIEEPYVRPLLQANIWHLRGRERDLLVDCGLGFTTLVPLLRERFDREPVLVLTHAHLDHIGSAYEFSQVWAHPLELVDDPAPGSLHGPVLAAQLGLRRSPATSAADRPSARRL